MTVKKVLERITELKRAEEWMTLVHTNEDAKCSFGHPNDEYFRPIVMDLIGHEYQRLQQCEVQE